MPPPSNTTSHVLPAAGVGACAPASSGAFRRARLAAEILNASRRETPLMDRSPKSVLGEIDNRSWFVYYVINRVNGPLRWFNKDADSVAIEQVLEEACERVRAT